TQTDTCQSGACEGSTLIRCNASDACHDMGTCDPSTGECSNPPVMNGTICKNGKARVETERSQSGAWEGSNQISCNTSDACHDMGTCDPSTGECSNPPVMNGTICNDGNECTQTDTCQSGACEGSTLIRCNASDACHDMGTCDPSTGECSNPPVMNGTIC